MEFLALIRTRLPPEMEARERAALLKAEAEAGRRLQASGVLRRIWRIPGQLANFSLWEAPDAGVVHEAISSLPLWPWMDVEVTALAVHPLEGPTD